MEPLPNPQEVISDINLPKPNRSSRVVIITIFLVIIFLVGGLIWWGVKDSNKAAVSQNPINQIKEKDDQPPLKLKSIGVNLDYYDPQTGKAGDFEFTKAKLQFNQLFMDYGFFIPASSASPDKKNPQPTFILPLGTPVRSLIDGVVANMPILWSGDISIQVTTDGKMQRWVYEIEHVINPKVKVGDRVSAGQIIAEVSNFDKGAPPGFG